MAVTNLGRVCLVPQGEYNAATEYVFLDWVYKDGISYVSLVTQTGVTPTNDGVNWQQVYGPTPGHIQPIYTNFVAPKKNLWDRESCVSGYTLTNGEYAANASYCASRDFVAIGTATQLIADHTLLYVFYDSDMDYISASSKLADVVMDIPETAVYVKFAGLISSWSTALTSQVEFGGTATAFESFALVLPGQVSLMEALRTSIENSTRVVYPFSKNLYNYNSLVDGMRIGADGEYEAESRYAASYQFIYISGLTQITGNVTTGAAFYDENFAFISRTSKVKSDPYTVPATTVYVRFFILREYAYSQSTQLESGAVSTDIVAFSSSSQEDSAVVPENVVVDAVVPENAENIVLSGSSITWGAGLLDDSFVGVVDDALRTQFATSVLPENMNVDGTSESAINAKFYGGSALKLDDVDSSASFTLGGNELSISFGKHRENVGAAIVELYVDGELYDEFSTYNDAEIGSDTKNFTGNATDVMFDLGRCFTYNHVVTVDGSPMTGELCTAYGQAIPDDYLVIRKYESGTNEVNHYLYFAVAPGNGLAIVANFDYGEGIYYAKTTIGETTSAINGTLESVYGDGSRSYDPANPSALSTGLDYRSVDPRSIKTWRFTENKDRAFTLNVKELDPGGTGTPCLYLNFATNRMHTIMNAGIGGYTASELNTEEYPTGVDPLMYDLPDVVFLEYGVNDDWAADFVSYKQVTGVTEDTARRYPTIWLKSCAYVGADDYTIETSVLTATSGTRNSVTIDATGVTFGTPAAGDIITIGNYHGDNRFVQSRVITAWDTATASFAEPLRFDGKFGWNSIADIAGMDVRIRRITDWTTPLNAAIDKIKAYNPDVIIALIDTGLCNYYSRMLLGYPEAIAKIARDKDCRHIRAYKALMDWQYSQNLNLQAYLVTALNTTSDGSASYALVTAAGADPNGSTYGYRHFSVVVDGVERYGNDCHIEGGRMYSFADATADNALTVTDWNGKSATGVLWQNVPLRLVFTDAVPAISAEIIVKYSTTKWSSDDTHINGQAGEQIIGDVITDALQGYIL